MWGTFWSDDLPCSTGRLILPDANLLVWLSGIFGFRLPFVLTRHFGTVARQGLSRVASCLPPGCGQDCRFPAGRRPSSPIRTARGLIRAATGFAIAVAGQPPHGADPVAPRRAFPCSNLPFRRRTHKAWQPADRRSGPYPRQRHGGDQEQVESIK